MNILFIAPNYLPHIGGVERHLQNLCEEMLKDNHQITILTMKHDNSYKDYELKNTLEIIRISKSTKRFINRINILRYIFLNIKMILKYDVVHFHDFNTFYSYGVFMYPVLKLFSKKIYITFHGWEGDIPPRKSVIIKRRIAQKLTNANICIGHFIQKWYGTKADIVSYGGVKKVIDLSTKKEEYILFTGRLANDTGILSYIKAWKVLSKKNSDLRFVICGDGALRREIELYVKKNNIKRVVFKGFVTNIQSYIQNAKIVFTSGYLGILEAFSYKKSVISIYDNELKKDYLKMIPNYQNMMWVINNNQDNILTAVDEAINDRYKKEIAYKFSLENSWEKVKKDYYRLWQM